LTRGGDGIGVGLCGERDGTDGRAPHGSDVRLRKRRCRTTQTRRRGAFWQYAKASQAEWAERACDGLRAKWPDRTSFAKQTSSDDDPGLTDRVGPPVSERRPNRTSSVAMKNGPVLSDWAGPGGRRWAAAGLENKGGRRAETNSRAEIK
jgi:hypothetical protein